MDGRRTSSSPRLGLLSSLPTLRNSFPSSLPPLHSASISYGPPSVSPASPGLRSNNTSTLFAPSSLEHLFSLPAWPLARQRLMDSTCGKTDFRRIDFLYRRAVGGRCIATSLLSTMFIRTPSCITRAVTGPSDTRGTNQQSSEDAGRPTEVARVRLRVVPLLPRWTRRSPRDRCRC